eukprot:6184979-Pleurochrysis_carterae.AAC.2
MSGSKHTGRFKTGTVSCGRVGTARIKTSLACWRRVESSAGRMLACAEKSFWTGREHGCAEALCGHRWPCDANDASERVAEEVCVRLLTLIREWVPGWHVNSTTAIVRSGALDEWSLRKYPKRGGRMYVVSEWRLRAMLRWLSSGEQRMR